MAGAESNETVWVLESAYGYRNDIAHAVEILLQIREFEIQSPNEVWEALTHYRDGKAGFSDCHPAAINRKLGCTSTLTLDKKAACLASFRAI